MYDSDSIYETRISDARWWAFDIPGNAGWIMYLICLGKSLRHGLKLFTVLALPPAALMGLGVGELIGERLAGLDRVLPGRRLRRGFGALTAGGVGGAAVSALALALQREKRRPAVMLLGSVLCAVFAGLCLKGYRKR